MASILVLFDPGFDLILLSQFVWLVVELQLQKREVGVCLCSVAPEEWKLQVLGVLRVDKLPHKVQVF